jgi:hypothetical protein
MFEAFERRQVDRRKWIVPAVVAVAAPIGLIMLIMLWQRTEERRALERLDQIALERRYQMWNAVDPPAESFVRVELPGMSLEAPTAAAPTGDYATGSVSQLVPDWAVSWQMGELPPADVLQSAVGTMGRALEQLLSTTNATLDRGPARQFKLRSESPLYFVWITLGECDGRVVQIINRGISRAKDTHDHMVESFRCQPRLYLRPRSYLKLH